MLSLLGRDPFEPGDELGVEHGIHRPVPNLRASWVFAQKIFPLPILRRPDRARNESATAIRANIMQDRFNAGGAERAFIAADSRFKRFGRKGSVAVLTSRSQFKHIDCELFDDTGKLSNANRSPARRARVSRHCLSDRSPIP